MRVLPWPAGVLDALREAWAQVAREEGIRDYFFKEVLEDIETFQAGAAGQRPALPAPMPQAAEPAAAGTKPAAR